MDLIAQLKRGEETAIRRFAAEYGARLHAAAMVLCRNPLAAEDLAFRTLERGLARLDSFDVARGEAGLFAWLCGIQINFWRMDGRKVASSRVTFTDEVPESELMEPAAALAVESLEAGELLREAVGRLSEPLREVVVLRYLEGMGIAETAEVLQINEGTVKSRLHNALARLREVLPQDVFNGEK